MDIDPPPDRTYGSYEEALDALRNHGMQHGYGFHIQRKWPHNSEVKTRYYYQCDKSKTHRSKATVRSTSTRATGCPFKLVIFKMKSEDDDSTNEQWVLQVTNKEHNHEPSLHASAHLAYHKRTAAQTDTIQSMTRAGSRPMEILTALQQQDPDTLVTAQNVRNDRAKVRAEHLNGRSPIETLLDDLSSPEWIFDVKRDSDNRVQYLFFAHKKQVEMQRANPDVLMMDCTYRTNKYKLPLLHILGCTNLQTFFSAGFCFLRNETQLDYHWAVSTFLYKTGTPQPRVFISDHEDALKSSARQLLPRVPQLLCVWHVNKNVQTKVQLEWRTSEAKTKEEKKAMEDQRSDFMGRWNQIVYSKTEAEFESKWKALQNDYKNQDALCRYLRKNQYPVRHQWARPWTSQHRHYGTTSTSPLEGMHKVLKDYLMTSKGDLLRVVQRIEHMVLNQYNKYRDQIASAKNKIKHEHRLEKMPFLPPDIHSTVTPPAIEHVRKQHELRQKHRRERRVHPCTGSFERINGLPCYHTIQSMEDRGSSLRMAHFDDDHWRYQRREGPSMDPPPRQYQFVLEPLTVRPRGAPRRSEASTRRDPSAFERPVPARPSAQSPPGRLKEVVKRTETTTRTSLSPEGVPVTTTSISESQTAVYVSSPSDTNRTHGIRISSPIGSSSSASGAFSPTLDGASAPQQPVWQPPTLEEFEEDIRRRQSQPVLQACNDPAAFGDFLKETGQEADPVDLVLARQMALDTTGVFAESTPRMAWNWHFGDKNAFYAEKAAQNRARDALSNAHSASTQPLKRPAPEEAQDASIPRRKKRGSRGPRGPRGPRRCGICRQEGHYYRTCPIGNEESLAVEEEQVEEEQAVADTLAIGAQIDAELAQGAGILVEATKKKRGCGICRQEGHYYSTCPFRS
jgi:hypothetical protein